jgi:hypothetical protein
MITRLQGSLVPAWGELDIGGGLVDVYRQPATMLGLQAIFLRAGGGFPWNKQCFQDDDWCNSASERPQVQDWSQVLD